jgi:hypothetical protein
MKIALVVVALSMAFSTSAALGQTAQDRQACIGDVLRLCSSAIPDRGRIIACMLQNRSQLGAECRAVVARHTAKPGRVPQLSDKPAIEQTSLQ